MQGHDNERACSGPGLALSAFRRRAVEDEEDAVDQKEGEHGARTPIVLHGPEACRKGGGMWQH